MNNPLGDDRQRSAGRISSRITRTAGAMRIDLAGLHATWMELVFSREFRDDHSVIEHWKPVTTRAVAAYRLWAALGALVLLAVYPFFVLGLATRYYARRLDRWSAGLGFAGVALLSLLVWGALSVTTYVSSVAFEGFVAVVVAGVVATISAVLALFFTRRDGRAWTVALGYPFGMTAIFLPPVVASLYSPMLASVVFPNSESLAIWLLDNVLHYGGLAAFIRASFDLVGVAYVGMWFGLAVPTGWVLGLLVTFVSTVRESRRHDELRGPDSGLV